MAVRHRNERSGAAIESIMTGAELVFIS